MTMPMPPAAAPRNRLLARLPDDSLRRLAPHLEPVGLKHGQVVYEARAAMDHAYFPIGVVLSALTLMLDGDAIEVGTVGNEGMIGHYGTGGKTSPHQVVAQLEGGAIRVASQVLRDQAAQDGPLQETLTAYHIAFMAQVSQSVACNGLHRLEQRCCRWLLMSRDRVGSDDLKLTHEFLAMMLGSRRASVTDVLRPLQDGGLVRSTRGRIAILDGPGVEARACECYRVVRDEYDRLLGPPT